MRRRWSIGLTRVRNPRYDALAKLEPYEFEKVVANYYRRQGYKVDHCGGRGRFDGGIDLKMYRNGEYVIVQCKRENVYQVPHNVGHQLLGILLTEKADRAIVVNTGEFKPYAIETAAREPRLELIDGDRVREMLPEYARPVSGPEPTKDLDKYVFTVPLEARIPARQPMVASSPSGPSAKPKRSRPLSLDRRARERSPRRGGGRTDGARALMAFAMLAAILVWQCSREAPKSSASSNRGPSVTAPAQSKPPPRQPDSRTSAGGPRGAGGSPSERPVTESVDAYRSPEESRRRADEAMRILAPTTPEFEPLTGPP